jgi:hypothetical protein
MDQMNDSGRVSSLSDLEDRLQLFKPCLVFGVNSSGTIMRRLAMARLELEIGGLVPMKQWSQF